MIGLAGISSAVLRAGAAVGVLFGLREVRKTVEVVPEAGRTLKAFLVPITIIAAAVLAWVILGRRGGK